MIKRETVVSLLAGFLVGACGIAPVVAGSGFDFGPAQGAASGGGGSGDLTAITETGSGLTITSGTGPVPNLALEAGLEAIAGLAKTDGNVIVGDGSTWVAESGATARTSLGLAIGTNVQAYASDLDNLVSALTVSSAGVFTWGTGLGAVNHLTGPTDQNLSIMANTGRDLSLGAGGAAGAVTVTAAGNLSLATASDIIWPDVGLTRTAAGVLLVDNAGGTGSILHVGAGSASAVSLGINADANTGWYGVADTSISASIGGTEIATVQTKSLVADTFAGRIVAAGDATIDFDDGAIQTLSISADTTFDTTLTSLASAQARACKVYVTADGTPRTLTFPTDWKWIGTKPSSLAASTTALLSLESRGPDEDDVVACWSVLGTGS